METLVYRTNEKSESNIKIHEATINEGEGRESTVNQESSFYH